MTGDLDTRMLEIFYIQMLFFFGPGLAALIDMWVAKRRGNRINTVRASRKSTVLDSRWRTLQQTNQRRLDEQEDAREKRDRNPPQDAA